MDRSKYSPRKRNDVQHDVPVAEARIYLKVTRRNEARDIKSPSLTFEQQCELADGICTTSRRRKR